MSAERNLRWVVETSGGGFDDVGAASLDVDGGCLVFRNDDRKVVVAYSAGRWVEVCEGAE